MRAAGRRRGRLQEIQSARADLVVGAGNPEAGHGIVAEAGRDPRVPHPAAHDAAATSAPAADYGTAPAPDYAPAPTADHTAPANHATTANRATAANRAAAATTAAATTSITARLGLVDGRAHDESRHREGRGEVDGEHSNDPQATPYQRHLV